MLASEVPNEGPISTLSIYLYNILLNIKYNFLVAKDRRSLNSLFFQAMNMSLFFKRLLVQISMVSSRGMLVKIESISKLPMTLPEFCSTISVAKLNKSLTVYLFLVNGSKIGTKYFAGLYVGVCKVDKICLKDGQPSMHFYALCKNRTLFQA